MYFFPNTDNFGADDVVYKQVYSLAIELYTENKNIEIEQKVEQALDAHEIFWNKEETYLDSEDMYEIIYESEVLING